jgi:hypothetical protein
MCSSALKEYTEICFIFFQVVLYFSTYFQNLFEFSEILNKN